MDAQVRSSSERQLNECTQPVPGVLAALFLAAFLLITPATAYAQGGGVRTLRIAIPKDYANLSVYTAGASDADPFVGLIYDTLFSTPYVDDPRPLLATSAEQTVRNRTWVVKLRDGVSWHDGEPFSAADVVFTYELYRDGPPNRWTHHASLTPNMRRVVALDDRTVQITCAQPCPTLAAITLADLPILPKHIWSNVADPPRSTAQRSARVPIGCNVTWPESAMSSRPTSAISREILSLTA